MVPNSKSDDNVLPPYRITLIFILGYAKKMTQWLQTFNINSEYNDKETPFSDQCNLVKFMDKINEDKLYIISGKSLIPSTWDINKHFTKIRDGEIAWEQTFQFKDQMTKSENREQKKNQTNYKGKKKTKIN